MTNLGKTNDQVGEMTVADILDLFAYWKEVPPPAETLLAAFGGGKRKQEANRGHAPTEQELRAMADLMNRR